jgi:hypothetical protein
MIYSLYFEHDWNKNDTQIWYKKQYLKTLTVSASIYLLMRNLLIFQDLHRLMYPK